MNPSQIVTLLTAITFFLGIYSVHYSQIHGYIISLLITVAISYVFPQFNHLRRSELFKCLVTSLIFGIINSYYIHKYFQQRKIDIFGVFMCMSTIRYYGQFQLINCFHHHQLQWHSYLIYHSRLYLITNIFLLLQHVTTRYLFNLSYKQYHPLMFYSAIVGIFCLFLRIAAFFTAKHNFTHQISYSKKLQHKLVTHGVYSIFRHPSYTGFFWYTVSTMVMIGNFLSAILFAIMLSIFFQRRIQVQQNYLLRFFGRQYEVYREKTYTFIPYLQKIIQRFLPVQNLIDQLR